MLRSKSLLAFLIVFGFSLSSFAAPGGTIRRGGIGFLFPDHNNFANPGQFSTARAVGVEGVYSRDTSATPNQALGTSLVYGNGKIGLGAFVSRSATNLTSGPHTDVAGAGLGVNLLKGRLTVGAGYQKPLTGVTDNGQLTGTLTLNPPNQKGVSLGVSFGRGLTSNVNSIGAGLGYSFSQAAQLEVNFQLPNMASTSNFNLQTFLNLNRGMVYFSGGYTLVRTTTSLSGVAGRVGFVLGRSIDFSAIATYTLVSGSPITYGGSFRASF